MTITETQVNVPEAQTIPTNIPQDKATAQVESLHSYARQFMTVFMAWFTFFCGYNMVIFPLVVAGIAKGELSGMAALLVTVWFVIQNLLAVLASIATIPIGPQR